MENNLTLTNATQIAQQFRSITPEELKFIEKLLASKDLWHKSTEELINVSAIVGSSGIGGIGGGGGMGALLGATGNVAGGGAAVGAAAGAGIASVFALIGAAIVGGHFIAVKIENDQEYQKKLDIEASKAEIEIYYNCLKEEYNNPVKALQAGIKINDERNDTIVLNRKHDLFNSWFAIRDMEFLTRDLNEQEKKDKEEYIKKILQYVKEEKLLDFQNHMRRYCAAKGIGEFSNTLPKWHSDKWHKREKVKNEIIHQCFENSKDEIGNKKKFEEIITKFYGTYKAILFLIQTSKNSDIPIDPKEITKYSNDLENFIKERVDFKTRKTFDKKFTQYRYLGGRCEFDRNNIFEMEEFDKYYSSDELFQEIKDNPGLLVASIFASAGSFGVYNLVFAGGLTGILKSDDLEVIERSSYYVY